ncbi:hypothetical protein SUVZ_13G1310 [Saccharomyces uvarum]|uniref:Uncharacterized protein n=1 Tax=Saccharomyces uvarum TaxID=230603 RepID=A0ABN8WJZ2_SACUV|nr:hypothetical protein SUVZ_13G1310 [Saccharomyces uvarum]
MLRSIFIVLRSMRFMRRLVKNLNIFPPITYSLPFIYFGCFPLPVALSLSLSLFTCLRIL